MSAQALADGARDDVRVFLKREDLAHTGAHKINNALGQALLARRMGKPRIVAETGAGQHGVATAAACALLGMDCVVYMGTTDVERQAPNVRRMHLLGAEVRPVATGNGTLRDALNEALRDWVANVETTAYILGSAAGPHPYPDMVAELQSVIGREARAQLLERIGRLPDVAVASVGGGSNAIGLFRPFLDARTRLVGVEAGGRGDGLGDNAASLGLGRPGVLHGAFTMLTQTEEGQVVEPHSVSAGLDYPGVGPQLSALAAVGRLEVDRTSDADAVAALHRLTRQAGILPALEPAHALAAVARLLPDLDPGSTVVVNLSGPRRQGSRHRRPVRVRLVSLTPGAQRVRDAFSRAADDGRRPLIAYLMAGYPDPVTGIEAAAAALESGADLLEIGVPFSDPVADGPVIAAAGHAAVAAGAGVHTVLETVRALRERGHRQPILAMGYLNPIVTRGRTRTLHELCEAGVDALIVPDLPAGEDPLLERQVADAGLGIAFLVTPNSSPARLEKAIRSSTAFLYVVPLYGVTGARDRVAATTIPLLERIREAVDGRLPVAVGFGISRPEHVRELAAAADGVIVGSAVVAALDEGGPARVSQLVRELVAATARSAGVAR